MACGGYYLTSSRSGARTEVSPAHSIIFLAFNNDSQARCASVYCRTCDVVAWRSRFAGSPRQPLLITATRKDSSTLKQLSYIFRSSTFASTSPSALGQPAQRVPSASRRRSLIKGLIGTFLVGCFGYSGAHALAYSDSGLDVPYVQTPDNVVDAMLELAGVGPDDFVIDLGSGDGRLLIGAATQRGARGFGVDIDPRLVQLANERAAEAGVADRAHFVVQDLFETDLSQATVIMMYLLPDVNVKLRPRILETVKPGTRIVSHDYGFGEWEPDRKITVDAPNKPVNRVKQSDLLYWVVPANVAGQWVLTPPPGQDTNDARYPQRVELHQSFQNLSGVVELQGVELPVKDGRVQGSHITLSFDQGDATVTLEAEVADAGIRGELRAPQWPNAVKVHFGRS